MRNLRLVLTAGFLFVTACSGSGGNGLPGGGGPLSCDPGTSVQLARPANFQTGVGSINSIEIVASGSSNVLYQTHSNWQLVTQDSFGNFISGGTLNLTSDTGGPHPYAQDFFYSSSFPNLQSGRTYTVSLSDNSGCTAAYLGTFST